MSNTGNVNTESSWDGYYKVVGMSLIEGPDVDKIKELLDPEKRSISGKPEFIPATFKARLCPSVLVTKPAIGGASTIEANATGNVSIVDFRTNIEGCEEFMSDIVLDIKDFSMLVNQPGGRVLSVSREVDENIEIRYDTKRRTGFVRNIEALS